ncbi:MAG: DUF3035 domain-containing protein [Alphaproteobacteria bacterium]
MRLRPFTVSAALAAAMLASACSDLTEAIGLSRRTPPDEFQVVTNAPLSVPPDFALRPPTPGQPGPVSVSAQQTARAAVVGSAGGVPAAATQGEQALLASADAVGVDPSIRQTVDAESRILDEDAGGNWLADILLFWRDTPPPGQIIDATAEAQRIRANQAAGRPITEGETPVIERTGGPIRLF